MPIPAPGLRTGRFVEKAGKYWFFGNYWDYKDMERRCLYL